MELKANSKPYQSFFDFKFAFSPPKNIGFFKFELFSTQRILFPKEQIYRHMGRKKRQKYAREFLQKFIWYIENFNQWMERESHGKQCNEISLKCGTW